MSRDLVGLLERRTFVRTFDGAPRSTMAQLDAALARARAGATVSESTATVVIAKRAYNAQGNYKSRAKGYRRNSYRKYPVAQIGDTFGSRTVVALAPLDENGEEMVWVRCACRPPDAEPSLLRVANLRSSKRCRKCGSKDKVKDEDGKCACGRRKTKSHSCKYAKSRGEGRKSSLSV